MAERRRERVGHLLQAKLAELLLREARDPRLQQVAVTAVRMTPDLHIAHVYFRTLSVEPAGEPTLRALVHATPFLRRAIGRTLGMRVTPELRFEYDTTPDTARRLESLLAAARPDDDDSGGSSEER